MILSLIGAAGGAEFSSDRQYRYNLTRRWHDGPTATFVMLNPSIAGADVNDPTVTRCINFARSWGCGGLIVVNLYALVATNPKDLWTAKDPIGQPYNDAHITGALIRARDSGGPVIAAWGAHARPARVQEVISFATRYGIDWSALKVTKSGAPGHPLRLRGDSPRTPWPADSACSRTGRVGSGA